MQVIGCCIKQFSKFQNDYSWQLLLVLASAIYLTDESASFLFLILADIFFYKTRRWCRHLFRQIEALFK